MISLVKNKTFKKITKKYDKLYKKYNKTKKNVKMEETPTLQKLQFLNKQTDFLLPSFEEKYGKEHKHEKEWVEDLTKTLNFGYIPKNINYKSDFYEFINYKWLKDKHKELKNKKFYYVKIDTFRVLQNNTYIEIHNLLEKYIKDNNNKQTQNIQKLINSYNYNTNHNQYIIDKHLKEQLKILNKLFDENDLLKLLTYINGIEMIAYKSPINLKITTDIYKPEVFTVFFEYPSFLLSNYNLYFSDIKSINDKHIHNVLINYIKGVTDYALGKDNNIVNPEDILIVQEFLIESFNNTDYFKNDDPTVYDKINRKDSLEKLGFDFKKYCLYYGFSEKNIPDSFLILNRNYLKRIMNELMTDDNWKNSKWRSYWIFIFCHAILRLGYKTSNFIVDFKKQIGMTSIIIPDSVRSMVPLSLCYNNLITKLYVDNNPKFIELKYIKNMKNDLQTVFIRKLQNCEWLNKKTKKNAILCIKKLNISFGTLKNVEDFNNIVFDNNDNWSNIYKISKERQKLFISLVGKPSDLNIPEINWNTYSVTGNQAYIVNASYKSDRNSIFISHAYIQKPFIDLTGLGVEYNLAFIGYTIAHEMAHSLDYNGRKYDYSGKITKWFENDKIAVRHIDYFMEKVEKNYKRMALRDNIKVNMDIVRNEFFADLVSFSICEEYLKDFQEYFSYNEQVKKLSFKSFFVYFAIQGRQIIYGNKMHVGSGFESHPITKYRINVCASMSNIYKSIYDIKKRDFMYSSNNKIMFDDYR